MTTSRTDFFISLLSSATPVSTMANAPARFGVLKHDCSTGTKELIEN